jgi:hypothetical protein
MADNDWLASQLRVTQKTNRNEKAIEVTVHNNTLEAQGPFFSFPF